MGTTGLTVVGFTGKAGSGKDHMGKMLWRTHGFFPLAFADALKAIVSSEFDIPISDMLGGHKTEKARTALQVYGTDNRRASDPQVWIKHLESHLRLISDRIGIRRFSVTDVRFQNEADWIRSLGGFVIWLQGRTNTGLTEKQQQHSSETQDIEADYVVKNDVSRGAVAEEEVRQISRSWVNIGPITPFV